LEGIQGIHLQIEASNKTLGRGILHVRTCSQEEVNMSASKFNLQNSKENHSQGEEKAYSLGDEFLPVSLGQWIGILNI